MNQKLALGKPSFHAYENDWECGYILHTFHSQQAMLDFIRETTGLTDYKIPGWRGHLQPQNLEKIKKEQAHIPIIRH